MSYNAYRQVQQRTEDPRSTEYRLFGEVTRALMEAENLPVRDPKVIKALDWNRRMWSTLSSDCGAPGNQLPAQLRASIISLSIWVSKHSSLIMRGKAQISALIQVNKTVMEGLKTQPQAQQTQATQSAQPQTHTASPNPYGTTSASTANPPSAGHAPHGTSIQSTLAAFSI